MQLVFSIKIATLSLLLSLLFMEISYAQNPIVFEGLKRTKGRSLMALIESRFTASPSDSLLQEDVQRLKNVAGIGAALYTLDTINGTAQIIFTIEELKTLLPILNFGGITGNIWFQAGISDINWLGKRQHLSAVYQNSDRRHGGHIYYKNPRIKSSNWGYSYNLYRWASTEPLYFNEGTVNYDYDNSGLGASIIRNIGFNRLIALGGTYFKEKYTKSAAQSFENTPGPQGLTQSKWLSKISYSEHFLNYHSFYLHGFDWELLYQNVFNIKDHSLFNTFQINGRYFHRVKQKGNLATRLRLGIASNNDTPFAPFVADSHMNIRGIGNRIDRGTAQFVLNIEYRQSIFETANWGAQLVAFADSGTWRNPGGTLDDLIDRENFKQFVGGGFRIIYKKIYGSVLRVDYGIGVYDKSQRGFVIGLGQYF